MTLSWVHIFGIIALFQSLVLSVFFFTNKKGIPVSNKIFGALLLCFSVIIGVTFSNAMDVYKAFVNYKFLIFVLSQSAFLMGPLLYLYIKSLLVNNFSFTKKELIHFIPFIAALLIFPIAVKNINYGMGWGINVNILFNVALLLVEFVYIFLSYKLLRENDISIRSVFVINGKKQISGARFFVLGFIFIWNIKLQSFLLLNIGERFKFCPYTESLYFLVMFLFLNSLVFITLKNPDFFAFLKKYKSSDLNEADKCAYQSKLVDILENEKLYLDPSLTLSSLSEKLGINSRYLSQIINESFCKNFSDFINEYRVKESKNLLIANSNGKKTMLEIAYCSGFNSKSSFYEAFKKYTGQTPREYKTLHSGYSEVSLG